MATAVEVTIGLLAHDAASAVIGNVTGKVQGLGAAGKIATAAAAALATAATAVLGGLVARADN